MEVGDRVGTDLSAAGTRLRILLKLWAGSLGVGILGTIVTMMAMEIPKLDTALSMGIRISMIGILAATAWFLTIQRNVALVAIGLGAAALFPFAFTFPERPATEQLIFWYAIGIGVLIHGQAIARGWLHQPAQGP